MQQLPQEFYELIYYILMDECFYFSYPHIRDRLLPIAEKFDNDNYQVYLKSNAVCQSFAAACQILTADEGKSQVDNEDKERTREERFSASSIGFMVSSMPTSLCWVCPII